MLRNKNDLERAKLFLDHYYTYRAMMEVYSKRDILSEQVLQAFRIMYVHIHCLDKNFATSFQKLYLQRVLHYIYIVPFKILLPLTKDVMHLRRCKTKSSKHFLNILSRIDFRHYNVFILMPSKFPNCCHSSAGLTSVFVLYKHRASGCRVCRVPVPICSALCGRQTNISFNLFR